MLRGAALIADFGSGMYLAGFVGDDIYPVFPSVVGMLKMLCMLVGMDLKDSTSLIVFFGNGSARLVLLVTMITSAFRCFKLPQVQFLRLWTSL